MGVVTLNQVGKEADVRKFTICLFGYWVLGIWIFKYLGIYLFGYWLLDIGYLDIWGLLPSTRSARKLI